MKFTLEINMDNAAFDGEPWPEVARILRRLADDLERRELNTTTLRDFNGNAVGQCEVKTS